MGSRCFLSTCLMSSFLFWGAAPLSAGAAQSEHGAKESAAETAPHAPGLFEQLRDFFHHLAPATESPEEARVQPDRMAALTPEQREQMRDQIRQQWQSATPEERQKRREEFHERWESATPEQRDQMRERARERWEQLSPEQRQQMRQHIEDRSGRSGGMRP